MSIWAQNPTVTHYQRRVSRVKDAHGAACGDCSATFSIFNQAADVPWSWRKSQAMHERGTGHRMVLWRLEIV